MKKLASKVWRKIIGGYGCIDWFCGAGGLSSGFAFPRFQHLGWNRLDNNIL
jgi:hypothetical protein